MKLKKLSNIFAIFLVGLLALTFVGCPGSPDDNHGTLPPMGKNLEYISIAQHPTKGQYQIGEALDKTGLKVTAYYSDSTNADVTASCTLTGFDSSTAGEKSVTVSYTEGSVTKTVAFSVWVINNQTNPSGNTEDEPEADPNAITAGDIILANGTIVKRASYTSIDSANPPVAVVIDYDDYNKAALGLGLFESEENLEVTPANTRGYELNVNEITIGTGGPSAYRGYKNGNRNWSRIYNATYSDETAQKELRKEVINAKKYFPAFYWANTYGETYKDYLGNATDGWYVPSIAEMVEIDKNLETINATLSAIKTLNANYSSGALANAYWSSSNCSASDVRQYAGVSEWYMDFSYNPGHMEYNYKNSKLKVLAVRAFKTPGSTNEANFLSIAVTKAPDKTKYIVNSSVELDTTGLKVTAYYGKNSLEIAKDVTADVTIDVDNAFDLSQLSDYKLIKIMYGESLLYEGSQVINTTYFPIAVINQPVLESLIVEGKKDYVVGDEIAVTVKALYSDNSVENVTTNATITGFDSSSPAWRQNLSISYTDGGVTKEAEYLVTINKYAPGSIILADGTVVSIDNYTFNSSNRPVAIVAGTTSTGKVLGVGMYATLSSTGSCKWYTQSETSSLPSAFNNIKCAPEHYTSYMQDGYVGMNVKFDASFTGDIDGSDNVGKIKAYTYYQAEKYPAFEWVSSYGATFEDYLGGVTTGWYLPSLPELCTVYKYIEAVNETLSSLWSKLGDSNYPAAYVDRQQFTIPVPGGQYWTSSPANGSGFNVWFVDFYKGFAANCVPDALANVLVVHSFD